MPEFETSWALEYRRIDAFTEGYLHAMEWTECNEDRPEMEMADPSEALIAAARQDCVDFQRDNRADLAETGALDYQNGIDFWLTRNRHGAGFWDRGYGPVGDRLTEAAHVFGEVDLYVGDDGLIYSM